MVLISGGYLTSITRGVELTAFENLVYIGFCTGHGCRVFPLRLSQMLLRKASVSVSSEYLEYLRVSNQHTAGVKVLMKNSSIAINIFFRAIYL